MELQAGSPHEAGMCPRRIERLRAALREWMPLAGQQAVVALAARRGVVVLHEALGSVRPEPGSPSTRLDTIFWVASITKLFTATAAMILVEEGRLGLNLPASFYVPELTGEGTDAVTVLHLLTHTSGFSDRDVHEHAKRVEPTTPQVAPAPTENAVAARYLALRWGAPLSSPPGQEMSYSCFGYQVLGEIVRRVSGRSLKEFARDRVYERLGMHASYGLADTMVERTSFPAEAPSRWDADDAVRRLDAAGCGFATAWDLAIFGQTFLNGGQYGETRILAPTTVAAMTRNQVRGVRGVFMNQAFPEACWGLGWQVLEGRNGAPWALPLATSRAYCHGGQGGAFVWVDPVHELVGVYLAAQDTSRTLSRYPYSSDTRHFLGSWLFSDAIYASIIDDKEAP